MTGQLALSLQFHQDRATGIDAVRLDSPAARSTLLRKMRQQGRSTIHAMRCGNCTLTWWGIGPAPVFVADYLSEGGQLAALTCTRDQIEALPT